ncbi:MAG TPA: phosphoesterase, partial [Methanocorpusculum sp.]|nr:phosphoesterase [Methanocorpusculum sp.]
LYQGNKYKIVVMPSYGYPSETAAVARKKYGSDIELLVLDSGKFSLRSVAPISHIIARNFKGGGHPNASGGSFVYGFKEKWCLKLFGKVSGVDEFIKVVDTL